MLTTPHSPQEQRPTPEEIPPSSGEATASAATGAPPNAGGAARTPLADVVIAASKTSRMDFLEQENAYLRSHLAKAEAHLSPANVQGSPSSRCSDSPREAEHVPSTGDGRETNPRRTHSTAEEVSQDPDAADMLLIIHSRRVRHCRIPLSPDCLMGLCS